MFMFHNPSSLNAMTTITDFNVGEGDSLNIHELMMVSTYDPDTMDINDFLKITESGSDSILSIDLDGTDTNDDWADIATLAGVTGLPSVTFLVGSDTLVL